MNMLRASIASIRAADPRWSCWRARPVAPSMTLRFSALCLCSVLAGCSLHTGDALYPQKVLGVADVIEVPTQNRWRLDDFTCGPRLLICEDRIGKLRCRCSEAGIVEVP